MAETPWFTSPPDAALRWGHHVRDDLGYLHFIDPNGDRAVVWVSKTVPEGGDKIAGQNVWHIDVPDETPGTLVTVTPSIHFIDYFHSPRPVQFRLVDALPDTVAPMDADTPTPAEEGTTTMDAENDVEIPVPTRDDENSVAVVETDPSVLAGTHDPEAAGPPAPAGSAG